MEPSTKKRKLAPKLAAVDTSPSVLNKSQPSLFPRESPHLHQLPPLSAALQQVQHLPPAQPQPYPGAQDVAAAAAAAAVPSATERQDFESFARHLQDAAMLIQRQSERAPYAAVSVLLLRWEGDGAADDQLDALDHVFRSQYRYGVQNWHIPLVNSQAKFNVQIDSFLDSAGPDHLLIIYYSGHGFVSPEHHLYWANSPNEDSAKVEWDRIRRLLEDVPSDMLLLLDTCSLPDQPIAGQRGTKQVLAAYGEPGAHRPPPRSFTAHLIDSLRRLGSGRAFGVQQLFDSIHKEVQLDQDRAQGYSGGTNGVSNGPPAQLPVSFPLTMRKTHSIRLAPLPPNPLEAVERFTDPNKFDSPADDRARGLASAASDANLIADIRFDEARVLVCTTFVGDASPDMSHFSQWLQNTPPLGSSIAVEGMFLGPPTMLLISMPSSLWSVVQHDKVCWFLGYITSHNMLHLYHNVVESNRTKPSPKEVADGQILLEASRQPSGVKRDIEGHAKVFDYPTPVEDPVSASRTTGFRPFNSPIRKAESTMSGTISTPLKTKPEVEESSEEVQAAAEQLKALSHFRRPSDAATRPPERRRTMLPDSVPRRRGTDSQSPLDRDGSGDESPVSAEGKSPVRFKMPRRALPKNETRCSHCTHAPFRDSSSLRKHIAAAHTRPFPCAFAFAGCDSTFGSKNEWKRHIASQHLCLTYYRCSACSTSEGKGNEFNRKDLFTQHLRRMHAPFPLKRLMSKTEGKAQDEWELRVKELQRSCLVTRRRPPQYSACVKPDCPSTFEGPGAWDEWTEHVGRHMEKGDAPQLGVDPSLIKWALKEGIIEHIGDDEYRLTVGNGMGSVQADRVSAQEYCDSINVSMEEPTQIEGPLRSAEPSQVEEPSQNHEFPVGEVKASNEKVKTED